MTYFKKIKSILSGSIAFLGLIQSSYANQELFEAIKNGPDCLKKDQELAFTLGGQLQECEFSKVTGYLPNQRAFTQCVNNTLKVFSKIQTRSCKRLVIAPLKNVLAGNIAYQFEKITRDSTSLRLNKTELDNSFENFKHWMKATTESIYRHTENSELLVNQSTALQDDLDQIMRVLWNKVWSEFRDPRVLMQEDQVFTFGLPSFTQIITSATAHRVEPLVLFPILEQILTNVHRRSQFFTEMAEFVCQMSPCNAETKEQSEIFIVKSFFSNLDKPMISNPSTDSNINKIDDESMREFLRALMTTQVYHAGLLREMSDTAEKISDLPVSHAPQYARGYLSVLNDIAREMGLNGTDPFLLTFGFTDLNVQKTAEEVERIEGKLRGAIAKFNSDRSAVANSLVNSGQAQQQDRALTVTLASEKESLVHFRSDLHGLKSALINQRALSDKRMKSSTHLFQTKRWKDSQVFRENGAGIVTIKPSQAKFDSNLPRSGYQIIGSLATSVSDSIRVNSSEILNLSVTGTWSPTCALRKMGHSHEAVIGPEGFTATESHGVLKVHSTNLQNTQRSYQQAQKVTGEETRHVNNRTSSRSSQKTRSSQNSTSERDSRSQGGGHSSDKSFVNDTRETTTVSASVSIGYMGNGGFSIGGSGGVSKSSTSAGDVFTESDSSYSTVDSTISTDVTHTSSTQETESTQHEWGVYKSNSSSKSDVLGKESASEKATLSSNSDENRRLDAFEVEVKSQFTPFPNLPMGSLLLVQLPKGVHELSELISVQVGRRNMVIPVDQDSDYYWVVNDCTDPGRTSTHEQSLSVQYSKQVSMDRLAADFVRHLSKATEIMREKSAVYLRSGDVSSTQLKELETLVRAELAKVGMDVEELHLLKDLYDSWIANELAQLELRVKILQTRRKMSPIKRRIVQLEADLRSAVDATNISKLSKFWAIDNFDLTSLNLELNYAMKTIRDRVLPVIKVRYPNVVPLIQKELSDLVLSLKMQNSVLEVARKFELLVISLNNILKAEISDINVVEETLVIRFPRAGLGDLEEVWGPNASQQVPLASPAASQEVWAALEASAKGAFGLSREEKVQHAIKSVAVLDISRTDLYSADGPWDAERFVRRPPCEGFLDCKAAAPIVESMAIYFKVNDSFQETVDSFGADRKVKVKLASKAIFPNEGESREDRFQVAGSWGEFTVPVFLGTRPSPLRSFRALMLHESKRGQGISPFGQFQIDFRDFQFDQGDLAEILPEITDIMLVFKVNYRNSNATTLGL
jgi:hypothetical protein